MTFLQTVFILIFLLAVSSCAKLEHLDEALMLKDYASSQDATLASVKEKDRKFEELLATAQKGPETLKRYSEKKSFLERFGEPILKTPVERDDRTLESWLYRYQVKYFGPKVYVFFDDKGRFVDCEYVPAAPTR
ncbi:MAG: hypothetical protein HQL16_07640 [Candidatus Omnitrophica bacterium]|nr:hypothetical protein [Candidatus Omnitrophota bacterium]